jgi:FkbM family methyltransferase
MKLGLGALASSLKARAETVTGCRIYRNSLPQGTDLAADIGRSFGRENIRTVFDVGANVGQSALEYLEIFPQATIYSFEPIRATYDKLRAATGAHPRIRAYHCAMGAQKGIGKIYVASDSRKSSINHPRGGDHTEQIDLATLDEFTRGAGIQNIDFLKIDTEGHEFDVLQGATSLLQAQRIQLLMLECELIPTDAGFTPLASVATFLERFSYHLFGVYDQQLDWNGTRRIQYLNAMFVSAETATTGLAKP